MSYPNTTTAVADINGIYNISSGSSIPDPIQIGTINPITGNSTVYLENGELGPIDFDVKGQRTNQEVALFCNDNANEFILGTFEGDVGIYYGLTNDSIPSGLFCIGQRGQSSDIQISNSTITFYKPVNFVSPPPFVEQLTYTFIADFVGIWSGPVTRTITIKVLGDIVHMFIPGISQAMTSSSTIGSNAIIPSTFVNPLKGASALMCTGFDGQSTSIGVGLKPCNLTLGLFGSFYAISISPLYYASGGNVFVNLGGSNGGFADINVFWQK